MALAFLVSCLISAASFHDRTWRVFMTNSALNYSDMLSFLLPPCPVAPGLWASSGPCPPSVPHGPSAAGMASLVCAEGELPRMPEYSRLYPSLLLQGTDSHLVLNSVLRFSLLPFQPLKLLVVLVTVGEVAFPHCRPVCVGLSQPITTALFKALLI